uniref:Uncharacterized protein n=1 Tax=Lonomia obliqua TaxID=304329 RepID=Q5MGM9_LONON|nr:hypothetical protein 3 [Lonomia obliqua]
MTIDFYYMGSSAPCRTVLLTAAALDVKLNLNVVRMMDQEHLKPEYIKINPQHTIPTLVDDGFAVWESRAIARYLVNKYGGDSSLYPKDPKTRAIVDQRLDFDMGTLYQRYATYFYPQLLQGAAPDEAAFKKVQEALEFLNIFLEGNKYAAGSSLTIADLSLVATISTMEATQCSISEYPNIVKWYDLVKATAPGYKEANQKGIDEMKSLPIEYKAKG